MPTLPSLLLVSHVRPSTPPENSMRGWGFFVLSRGWMLAKLGDGVDCLREYLRAVSILVCGRTPLVSGILVLLTKSRVDRLECHG